VSDQHIDVEPDAIRDGDTGNPILTKEQARQVREDWTAAHPPIPGLRWTVSFNLYGEPVDYRLEVIPGWEDAFALSTTTRPVSARKHDVVTKASEANRLGALAYQGWHAALPEIVRESSTGWDDVPEPFREPMRQAAVLVWQHAENAGFHQALLRTLPSAQLGAPGALEDVADFIAALAKLYPGQFEVSEILAEIRSRVAQLRGDATEGTKRAKDDVR
jgi:hypothetical protein